MPHDAEDHFSRRGMLGASAVLIGWGLTQADAAEVPKTAVAAVPPDSMMVTLLGTGSPDPRPDRFGMSTLVQAGGLNLVFDAGRGCTLRLRQAGVALGKVDTLFITHFHSDHLNGLPDLWLTGFLSPSFGARAQAFEICGPPGISRIATTMRATFADDVRIRLEDEHVPEAHTGIVAHEFAADGIVFERNGVTVTAFEVNHGPLVKPAYGYRVDHAGLSVLLSGDTKFDENLIAHGQDVDLMVHEVAVAPKPILDAPYIQAIMDHHTTPEEAGTVFTRTKPRLAAFSHIVQLMDDHHPRPDAAEIERRTRTNWAGSLLVGSDLDRFVLTAAGVDVQHYDNAQGRYPG
jgi:ribonuclease Z